MPLYALFEVLDTLRVPCPTICNSMYFFAVIFFARIEFGYFVCSYKISLRSILQTTHSENQILYLRKKTHSSNLHTIAESINVHTFSAYVQKTLEYLQVFFHTCEKAFENKQN